VHLGRRRVLLSRGKDALLGLQELLQQVNVSPHRGATHAAVQGSPTLPRTVLLTGLRRYSVAQEFLGLRHFGIPLFELLRCEELDDLLTNGAAYGSDFLDHFLS
jgi:hypothetical protein